MNLSAELIFKNSPPNSFEWILMIIWSLMVMLVSMIGNTIVLTATVKYNAIKLDDISVVLIRNIAVADLGVAVYIASSLPGIIAKQYLYNDLFCILSKTFFYACLSTEVVLVAALSVSKLLWILNPLRALARSKKNGRIIAASIWLLMISLTAGTTLYRESANDNWTNFQGALYQCSRTSGDIKSSILFKAIVMSLNIIPQLVITVATLWLLALVRKAGAIHKQGLITILLVCALFFVSYAPYGFLYQILKLLLDTRSYDWFDTLYRWSFYIVYLNYAANPLIYFASIDSFNRFVKQRIFKREGFSLSERSTTQSYSYHLRASSMRQSCDTVHSLSRRRTLGERNITAVQV